MLSKEYRICMPLTVEEYQVGQLYMIARHSLEQSCGGEGVESIENRECDENEEALEESQRVFLQHRESRGKGQYTEKRIHLSSRLPYWLQAICPKIFYVTEKSWNYYPYTMTEYTCSFLPKFRVEIYTKFEDNSGTTNNCLKVPEEQAANLLVDHIDIAFDDLTKHYKEEEDPKFFKSIKTNRGQLVEGWRQTDKPMMCSYKLVHASFEVWGCQTRVEEFMQTTIREVLLLGHRQAFAWVDEWIGMSMEDVREYEKQAQEETNKKVMQANQAAVVDSEVAADVVPNSILSEID
ncbi:unnamed protein product [Diamesa tonsa]